MLRNAGAGRNETQVLIRGAREGVAQVAKTAQLCTCMPSMGAADSSSVQSKTLLYVAQSPMCWMLRIATAYQV